MRPVRLWRASSSNRLEGEMGRSIRLGLVVSTVVGVLGSVAVLAQDGDERWRRPATRWLEVDPTPGNRLATVRGYLEEMSWQTLPQEVLTPTRTSTTPTSCR